MTKISIKWPSFGSSEIRSSDHDSVFWSNNDLRDDDDAKVHWASFVKRSNFSVFLFLKLSFFTDALKIWKNIYFWKSQYVQVPIPFFFDRLNKKQDFNLKPFQIKFLACLLLVLITGHREGFGGHREGFGGLREYQGGYGGFGFGFGRCHIGI